MKKIGIIGGLGPEATVDYYKEIIKSFDQINGEGSFNYPEIIIYSVSLGKLLQLFEAKRYDESVDYLVDAISNLKNAGVDFAVLSANTPHLLFNQIQEKVDMPLISIVEACAEKAKEMGLKNMGLLGTKFTMQNRFYQEVFDRLNTKLIVPDSEQIQYIHHKLFTEMELGVFKEETKNGFLDIISKLKSEQNIDSIILGCTEFPIMFKDPEYLGMPFLNTTKIHVDAIVKECLNG